MDKKEIEKLKSDLITERGLILMREMEEFHKDKDLTNPVIENEEDCKILEEKLKKIEWYGEQIEIEEKKSIDKAIEKLSIEIIDENKEFFEELYPYVESFTSDQKIMIYLGYMLGGKKVGTESNRNRKTCQED